MNKDFSEQSGRLVLSGDAQPQKAVIGEKEVTEAYDILLKYRNGKAALDARIIEEEQWWRLRHWQALRGKEKNADVPQPTSAWTFNAVMNKHADLMDVFPEPIFLPRESSDEQSADILSSIVPVILDRCSFENVYSDNSWYKLKHGVSCYGVFWDNGIDNGFGDVRVSQIDILNLAFEPGITDIQKSKNLFIISLCDTEDLKATYPQYADKINPSNAKITAEYVRDDAIDTSGKTAVIDWYYKKRVGGKTILHYCKFVGSTVLYASENDETYRESGFYEHGLYPVVFDVLFPEAGTCYGFGIISVTKDPQLYIDKLDANILKHSYLVSNPRWFIKKDCGVNPDDFLNLKNVLIEVEGDLTEERLRPITIPAFDNAAISAKQLKIDELKETSANRDVNSGGTTGSVTSGTAIAALQEAGNKVSRDIYNGTYRAFKSMCEIIIELIRQFYTEPRAFRIIGENGAYKYVEMDNSALKMQSGDGDLFRKPVFDISVTAQRKNPFSVLSQNETASNLYGMGVFNPENAQAALGMLEMMQFEGRDKVIRYVEQGQTLMNIVEQLQQQLMSMQQALGQFQASSQAISEQGGTPEEQVSAGDVAALRNGV